MTHGFAAKARNWNLQKNSVFYSKLLQKTSKLTNEHASQVRPCDKSTSILYSKNVTFPTTSLNLSFHSARCGKFQLIDHLCQI